MADEIDVGTASEAPDPTESIKNAALGEMAKDENPENYFKERQARTAESQGKEVDEDARAERIRQALEKARKDTAAARNGGELPPDMDAELAAAEAQWREEVSAEQTVEDQREQARAEGRFTATAEVLKASNPQAHAEITNTLGALDMMMQPDQLDILTREVTKGDPRESLAVLHRLTQPSFNEDGSVLMNPQAKLEYLASMPPDQLQATLAGARQWLQLEHQISRQYEAKYRTRAKKVSSAPAPFRPPKGGANPPKDINALARKDDVADYAKARRAQMKNADDR